MLSFWPRSPSFWFHDVQQRSARHVNADQLLAYWNNGRMIVVYEQGGRDRAEYGDRTLVRLSKRLTSRLGRGFSRTNLQYMRLLYLKHSICQTLSGKLTWSHYCELLDLTDDAKRSFHEREAANSGWSVRECASGSAGPVPHHTGIGMTWSIDISMK